MSSVSVTRLYCKRRQSTTTNIDLSKLPVRQLTYDDIVELINQFSKLPVRQLTEWIA